MVRPSVVVRPVEGGADDWGVTWRKTNAVEGSYPDGKPVLSPAGIDQARAPETDFPAVRRDMEAQIGLLKGSDSLIIAYNELTLFERAQLLLGTEELLIAAVLEQAKVLLLLDMITEYQEALTECLMSAGAEGVRFTDDWGMQDALVISPELWRILVKPRMKRLYDIVKKRGGFVFQHTCGHVEEIVLDLIEIGVDVLDPCQPRSNDIFGWKRRYGDRLSFMGGLDTQGYLSFADPREVRGEVKRVAAFMGRGGGYIPAPSHKITIPEENSKAMLEAITELNVASQLRDQHNNETGEGG